MRQELDNLIGPFGIALSGTFDSNGAWLKCPLCGGKEKCGLCGGKGFVAASSA
ncbi:MAG: hypothetical protein QW613_02255 [Thermoprotei archaeon]